MGRSLGDPAVIDRRIAVRLRGLRSERGWSLEELAAASGVSRSMLSEIERVLKIETNHGTLADDAFAWERGIDEIAEGDEEMANYISQLEKTRDEVESPAATGESPASVTVEPGDAEVELGRSLIVTARFGGEPPASAALASCGSVLSAATNNGRASRS